MAKYMVVWEIEVTAKTHKQAALEAYEAVKDGCTVFTVTNEKTGKEQTIDLY